MVVGRYIYEARGGPLSRVSYLVMSRSDCHMFSEGDL